MGLAVALCGLAFAVAPADAAPNAGWSRSADKGRLQLELYRGAVVSPGGTTIATPNSCKSDLDLNIDWNETRDQVHLRLSGERALSPYPDVIRPDEHYQENLLAHEPQNVEHGQYRLWLIGAAGSTMSFYYDKTTHELLGGGPGYDPPQDPDSYEVLEFPTQYMFPTPPIEPKADGDVDLDWTFSYESPPLGEFGDYSYYVLAYVPSSTCEYNPFRPDLTTYIPYIAGPLPRDQAHPFSDYLGGGLLFDVTVQPLADYYTLPKKTTIETYSNTTTIAGTVPKGWTRDFDAALAGLAPPIYPWSDTDKCEDVFAGFHTGQYTCDPVPQ